MHVLYAHPNFTTLRGARSTRAYDFAGRRVECGLGVTLVTEVYDKSDLRPDALSWIGAIRSGHAAARGVWPNKLFDAFAAGIPVIQTTQGWMRNVLSEHDCGITIDTTQPTALADATVEPAGEPPRRDRMARAGRRLAREVYSVDRLAVKLLDTLAAAQTLRHGASPR